MVDWHVESGIGGSLANLGPTAMAVVLQALVQRRTDGPAEFESPSRISG
jgi:carbon monoxide dehydrogenase subunit G